jgi:hypothetical protein
MDFHTWKDFTVFTKFICRVVKVVNLYVLSFIFLMHFINAL